MPCCLKLHALTNLLMKPTNDMKQHIKEKDSYNITPNKVNFISSLKATKKSFSVDKKYLNFYVKNQ